MSNCCKIVVRYFSCDEYLKCLGSRSRWVNISWQYISCILKEVYVVKIAVIVWLHRLQDGISWLSWCLHQQIIPWNWQDNSGYRTLQTECNIYSSSSGKMCVYRLNSIVSWDCLREVFIFWCFLIPLWPFHHFRQSFKECYTCVKMTTKNPEEQICYGMDFMTGVLLWLHFFWDWKVNISVLFSFRGAGFHWDGHIPVASFEIISESVSLCYS